MADHSASPDPSFSELLDRYQRAVDSIANAPTVSETQVLEALLARDAIQSALPTVSPTATELLRLEPLDTQLQSFEPRIRSVQDLERWREYVTPAQEAWWWPVPPQWGWARQDWLWSGLSVVFLSVSASLILNTAARFWSGGIDSAGTLAVVGQSVLALIAGQGALTESGRHAWEKVLKQRHISGKYWHEWSCAAAGGVFLVVAGIHQSLPWVATGYNDWGWRHYTDGQLVGALENYQTALSLWPDYPEAQFHRGLVYEDLQQYEQAKASYQFVVEVKPDAALLEVWLSAHNNLARLYLLEGNDRAAAPLLIRARDKVDADLAETDAAIAEVNYNLQKNLGWVRLNQHRYLEAQTELEEAIFFEQDVLQTELIQGEDRAAAYCLLAQVAEAQQRVAEADQAWDQCLQKADLGDPDVDAWIGVYELREQAREEP